MLLSNQGAWDSSGTVRQLEKALFRGIGASPPAQDPSVNTTVHDGVTLRC